MVDETKGHRVFRKKVGNLFFEEWENPGRDGNPYVNYTFGRNLSIKEGEEFPEQIRIRLSKDEMEVAVSWFNQVLNRN